jgi:hypothetical protein
VRWTSASLPWLTPETGLGGSSWSIFAYLCLNLTEDPLVSPSCNYWGQRILQRPKLRDSEYLSQLCYCMPELSPALDLAAAVATAVAAASVAACTAVDSTKAIAAGCRLQAMQVPDALIRQEARHPLHQPVRSAAVTAAS